MPSTGNFGGQKVAESSQLAKSFTSCLNRQISLLGWWITAEKNTSRVEYVCFIVCLAARLRGSEWSRVKNCLPPKKRICRSCVAKLMLFQLDQLRTPQNNALQKIIVCSNFK
jgi:hypothetical protein